MMRYLLMAVMLVAVSHAHAQPNSGRVAWTCTYPGIDKTRAPVTATFRVEGNKVKAGEYGVPEFDILENNEYGLVATYHYSNRYGAGGLVEISARTIILDKTFGRFIYIFGVIGSEPAYAKGSCKKDQ